MLVQASGESCACSTVPCSHSASVHMRQGVVSVEGCDLEQQDP